MLWTARQRVRFTLPANSSMIRVPLILLIGLTVLRGILYLFIFPPFLAPDEPAHFEAVRLLGQEKKWPTHQVYRATPMHPQMISVFEEFKIWTLAGLYAPVTLGANKPFIQYYPPQVAGSEVAADSYLMLYHVSIAPLSAMVSSVDLVTQVYILRLVSVLSATVTVILTWFTIRAIFPQDDVFALGACSFIVFWPMHTHVTAAINVDTMAELVGALFFFLLVNSYRRDISVFRSTMLLTVLVIAIFTKPTLFFLAPTLMAVIIIYAGHRLGWSKVVIAVLIGLLAVLTWFGALIVYENSRGGRDLLAIFSTPLSLPKWSYYISGNAFSYYVESLNFALVSFGGLFGWSSVHIPWPWVKGVAIFCGLISVGILIFSYRHLWGADGMGTLINGRQKELLVIFLVAILFSLIGVVLPIVVTQSPSWGIHSRYYFPALVPLSLFIFIGFRQLIPTQWQLVVWPGWLLGWFFYDAAVFLVVLLPHLYS